MSITTQIEIKILIINKMEVISPLTIDLASQPIFIIEEDSFIDLHLSSFTNKLLIFEYQ